MRERYAVLVWEMPDADEDGAPLPLQTVGEAVIIAPFFDNVLEADACVEALDNAGEGRVEGRVLPLFTPAEARDRAKTVLDRVGYQVPS